MRTGVHLSRMMRLAVVSADRQPVGRLLDVSTILSAETPRLHRLAIGTRPRPRYVVPWSLVASLDDLTIRLGAALSDLEPFQVDRGMDLGDIALDADEVLLGRDVLDSQVVDLSGLRLSRVSDVLLTDDDSALAVVGVDLGLGALLRRLGFTRLGDRMRPVLVDWKDLHLASLRGNRVQLATAADGIRRLDPVALAEVLSRLGTEPAAEVLRTVGPALSAVALDASHDVHRRRLLRALPPEEARRVIDAAPSAVGRAFKELRDQPEMRSRRFRRTVGWRAHRPRAPQESGD
jgi:hypothetical protein